VQPPRPAGARFEKIKSFGKIWFFSGFEGLPNHEKRTKFSRHVKAKRERSAEETSALSFILGAIDRASSSE
jgi:hypothetical protein